MKRRFLSLLTIIFGTFGFNTISPAAALLDDVYALKCGALYGLLEQAYGEIGDLDNQSKYASKFDSLNIEDTFGSEYMDYLREHIDQILEANHRDRTVVRTFLEICDDGLQDFQNRYSNSDIN